MGGVLSVVLGPSVIALLLDLDGKNRRDFCIYRSSSHWRLLPKGFCYFSDKIWDSDLLLVPVLLDIASQRLLLFLWYIWYSAMLLIRFFLNYCCSWHATVRDKAP